MPDMKIPIEAVSEETLAEIRRIVEKESAKFIKGLPGLVKSRLDGITAQIAGLKKDSWGGKWEIDHCNGRSSTIGSFLKQEVIDTCEKFVGQIGTGFTLEEDVEKELRVGFIRNVFSALKTQLRTRAEAVAHEMVEAVVNETITDPIKFFTEMGDMQDPEFGATPMEKLVLERVAKKKAAQEAAEEAVEEA